MMGPGGVVGSGARLVRRATSAAKRVSSSHMLTTTSPAADAATRIVPTGVFASAPTVVMSSLIEELATNDHGKYG